MECAETPSPLMTSQEWLAWAHVVQDLPMWINQLEKSKDVIAQSQAVAGEREGL